MCKGISVYGEKLNDKKGIMEKALSDEMRIAATQNEDVRSLKEMLTIGCKGIAAYADHAAIISTNCTLVKVISRSPLFQPSQ